jgi:hypothetical protein
MYLPSVRVQREMRSEEASLWYVPTHSGEDDMALLLKIPTSSIKALITGCKLKLIYGKKEAHLCTGVRIVDVPDSPILISGVQREAEEHRALLCALRKRQFPVFLFNEMDVCLAWTNVELIEEAAAHILDFLGEESLLYVGPFTKETSHSLDCFSFSLDNTNTYPGSHAIPTIEISATIEPWRIIQASFLSVRGSHTVTISDKNEGEMFERVVWASLESVFPLTLYKSPQVKVGTRWRELTDVLSFYSYGSFMIEAKDLSILQAGYERDQERRIKGIQKQVKKAIAQLVGASKAFVRGEAIFDITGYELLVERNQPPHCIVLITELVHSGDWSEIEVQLMEAMQLTGAFFHLFDLRELIALLKGSSDKPELLDYNLMERCKLFVQKRSAHIRSHRAAR